MSFTTGQVLTAAALNAAFGSLQGGLASVVATVATLTNTTADIQAQLATVQDALDALQNGGGGTAPLPSGWLKLADTTSGQQVANVDVPNWMPDGALGMAITIEETITSAVGNSELLVFQLLGSNSQEMFNTILHNPDFDLVGVIQTGQDLYQAGIGGPYTQGTTRRKLFILTGAQAFWAPNSYSLDNEYVLSTHVLTGSVKMLVGNSAYPAAIKVWIAPLYVLPNSTQRKAIRDNGIAGYTPPGSDAAGTALPVIVQSKKFADGPLPTDQSVQPYGTTIATANKNILNVKFGTDGNVTSQDDLFKIFDPYAMFGNLNGTGPSDNSFDPRTSLPAQPGRYRVFPEFLPGGQRDPRANFSFYNGYVELNAHWDGDDGRDTTVMTIPYLRSSQTDFLPGDFVELGIFVPAGQRFLWPAWWLFGGKYIENRNGYPFFYQMTNAAEVDWDNFTDAGQPNGAHLLIKTPYPFDNDANFNSNVDTTFDSPHDTFRSNSGEMIYRSNDPYGHYDISPTMADRMVYLGIQCNSAFEWAWTFNGRIYHKKYMKLKENYPATDNIGRSTPSNLLGKLLPMTPMFGLQIAPYFNGENGGADTQDLLKTEPYLGFGKFKARLSSWRHWRSITNAITVGTSADLTTNPRG